MTAAHRRLYEAAAAGDLAAFEAQKQQVIRQFIITYIQASLKGSGRVTGLRHCVRDGVTL